MSDDRKGISLRKKRTVKPKGGAPKEISAPRQISAPVPTGLAAATQSSAGRPRPSNESSRSGRGMDAPRERPGRADKTADLVKRRYSQRITQLPSDFGAGAPPLPGMPQIPAKYRDQPPPSRDGRPSTSGRKLEVDMRALEDPGLRAEPYVTSQLANADEEEIRDYQDQLRRQQKGTSKLLQQSVYQNRTQFIKISKEAEKLKDEMRQLRQAMSELTTTLGQTTPAASLNGDSERSRKAANRSSVANLEALWNSHLQELWKRVEGSQKYLPAIPGRHIVWESGRWVELNAATWKAKRRIHLILLNDHLLVAAEKKQRTDVPGQAPRDKRSGKEWVAQRCWGLGEVSVADLSRQAKPGTREGDGAQNAINIRAGTDSYTFAVYQTDVSEKATFLSTFRKTLEELRKTQEDDFDRGRAQEPVNYFAARDPGILKKADLMDSLADSVANNRASMFMDVDGKQQTIRGVDGQIDDLAIDIALQHFEEAVKKVERLRALTKNIRGNATAQKYLTGRVDDQALKLGNMLIKQLVENNSWLTSVKKHTTWIMRLGFEDRARESYLEARTGVIRKRSRQCIFEGNLPDYIFQISFIYFTCIKNTLSIYQQCFPAPMLSAAVKWAKEHVDAFNDILAKQLSSVDRGSPVWKQCMDQAHEHAAMLTEVGLDFKELVGRGIETDAGEARPVGLGVTA
ncbi:Cullin repeat-like-containing domain protein [Lophiotrema nucula]|uniref:Exocyst complex component EXO84 n=1 Tax=Lophiotrema nucula TaxID=690887 RepID=A0A6A5ZRQ7_9PLEO|nr:Cullin repeat-like-containing domain protein [Lophiotrema nucula]